MAWVTNLTMVYFYNLLDLLGRRHCLSTIIWMFCTIAAFCVDDLVVIVSFLLPDVLDFFSAYCNTFTARTDLSPRSPTEMYDKSLFTLIAPIGFSYVSRILGCILAHFSAIKKKHLCLRLALLFGPDPGCFSSRVLGSRPWLFFLHGYLAPVPGCFSSRVLGSRPWLFVFLLVHLVRVLLRTSWLTASLTTFLWSPTAIWSMFRAPGTRCKLILLHFSFEPILGFHSRASPALAGFLSPDCDFLVIIVPVASLSRCFVRDFSSGLVLQLHLVVVHSDVAAGGSSSTAV